jgi:hypothetical protein
MRTLSKTFALATFLLMSGSLSASVIEIDHSAFGPAATLITFDELASGTVLTNQYAALGVQFQNTVAQVGPFPDSPPNVILATDLTNPIVILFPNGVFKVGLQIDSDGFDSDRQPQVRAFDATGNLLGTLLFGQGPDFEGFQATSGTISRLEIGSCRPIGVSTCQTLGYSDAYDNLVFALTPGSDTPEPSTLAYGALGALLCLAASRKRRQWFLEEIDPCSSVEE